MEKRFLLAIVLCFLIFVGWQFLWQSLNPPPERRPGGSPVSTGKRDAQLPREPTGGQAAVAGDASRAPGSRLGPDDGPQHDRETWTWTTEDMEVVLDSEGGSIASIHLLKHREDDNLLKDREHDLPEDLELFGPTFQSGPGLLVDLGENDSQRRLYQPWEIVARDDASHIVTFRRKIDDTRSIQKTIELLDEGYALTLTVTFDGKWESDATYRVFLPERIRNERQSKRYPDNEFSRAIRQVGGGLSHVEHKTVYELNDQLPDYYKEPREVLWGSISSIYFAMALRPLDGREDSPWKLIVRQSGSPAVEDYSLQSWPFQVGFERYVVAGQPHTYEVFCAPKSRTLLAEFEKAQKRRWLAAVREDRHGLLPAGYPELISYPAYIGWLTKLFFTLLSWFHWLAGSWGVAIVILTFFVKLGLHPINRKNQTVMMAQQKKMVKIQPKMKEIKERYPNDAMKANREIQELMREHGVNPAQLFGGCLLMFLQLPIWIALIMVFSMDLDLRQEGFLWIRDLTQPDRTIPLCDPEQPFTLLFFSLDAINLLPILYVIVTLVNQRFMPKSSDPQAQQQQTMMKWMMVFFGFIFYNFASGLLLYFLTSSSLGILESWLIRRELARREEEAKESPSRPVLAGPGSGKKKPGGGKKKSRGAGARR